MNFSQSHQRLARMSAASLLVGSMVFGVPSVFAGTDTWFTPLTESAPVVAPNAVEELTAPWVAPAGMSQVNLTSMDEIESSVFQTVQRAANSGRNASMWDMLAYHPSGQVIFIPHETPWGAGVSRYFPRWDFNQLIFAGDGMGEMCEDFVPEEPRDPTKNCPYWENDFAAFDPARWTPNNTVWLAEEWSGLGRVVEILNPLAPKHFIKWRVLESIANVAHEGIKFSKEWDDTVYYIDEWNSGSIYKFVMKKKGDYTKGQTFVLVVDDYVASGGVAADLWNDPSNAGATRFGLATWVPITNSNGDPLPGITDPFRDGPTNDPRTNIDTRGGRFAADDVNGTPYGRPEDAEIGKLANGNEVLYVTITSENGVLAIEQLGRHKTMVHLFASGSTTPTNVGHTPTTGALNSPDNLAIDALGNIYVIEDAPNSSSTGGDIWMARDTNNDGVAESLDHFLSIRVNGSEATGMIFHPKKPEKFVVAVQHPESTNLSTVPDGFGDAMWEFDLTEVNRDFAKDLKRALKRDRHRHSHRHGHGHGH